MIKVLAACGSGMGSSQIIKMKLANVFKKKNIPVEIHHCAVSEAKSLAKQYDIVFVSKALLDVFSGLDLPKTHVIGLQNLLSEKEITEQLEAIQIKA
ncbi:PTS sugar transporter subunit IIB [Globicatella sulfidifaciens]|uniref:PTS system IIB component, L-Asc family n=1 Tax=Globicatella sulfidifaciens DSM 15739 TaxID=1121925 RepID=A0A1T4LTQ9_9LACT|nr:PTS sugar transporter subunit IIB [Globicatella sulfidifaciens]SJZ58065.1 PTS system IIB component, L-Asc family [Globicatella sulfidifaciens DSM 15739]